MTVFKYMYYFIAANPTPSPTAPGQGTPMLTPTVVVVTSTNEIPGLYFTTIVYKFTSPNKILSVYLYTNCS